MDYLLDTNLILIYSRNSDIGDKIEAQYHLFDKSNSLAVSVVTLGELDALIKKLKMGVKRQQKIENMLKTMMKLGVNHEEVIQTYGDIDTFSQGKLNNKKSKFSARNMGKNDILPAPKPRWDCSNSECL